MEVPVQNETLKFLTSLTTLRRLKNDPGIEITRAKGNRIVA